MRKNLKPLVGASALAVALLIGTALYAHEDSPGGPGKMMQPGMMQGGMMGQGGMMNMMGQMNQMMATCNKMMQGMMQDHQGEPQKPSEEPENKG